MQSKTLHVSVIIPVYNEQERIATTLYAVKDYLSQQDFSSDIIVIDDGSQDLTSEIVKVVDHYSEEVKSQSSGALFHNFKNIGKGYSVAKGLLIAEGDVIVFTDADSSTPIAEIKKLLNKIDEGYDVVVGSRNLASSNIKGRPIARTLTSKIFNRLATFMGLMRVSDSQCGFKAYRKEVAREIANRQKTFGFCFDVEHIHLATKLGFKVSEVAVTWHHQSGSTVSVLTDSISMFCDLLKIRWIHRKL